MGRRSGDYFSYFNNFYIIVFVGYFCVSCGFFLFCFVVAFCLFVLFLVFTLWEEREFPNLSCGPPNWGWGQAKATPGWGLRFRLNDWKQGQTGLQGHEDVSWDVSKWMWPQSSQILLWLGKAELGGSWTSVLLQSCWNGQPWMDWQWVLGPWAFSIVKSH